MIMMPMSEKRRKSTRNKKMTSEYVSEGEDDERMKGKDRLEIGKYAFIGCGLEHEDCDEKGFSLLLLSTMTANYLLIRSSTLESLIMLSYVLCWSSLLGESCPDFYQIGKRHGKK